MKIPGEAMNKTDASEVDKQPFKDLIFIWEKSRSAYSTPNMIVVPANPSSGDGPIADIKVSHILARESIAIIEKAETKETAGEVFLTEEVGARAVVRGGAILVNDRHALKGLHFKVVDQIAKSKDSFMPTEISIEIDSAEKFDSVLESLDEMGVKYGTTEPRGAGGKNHGFEITISGSQNITAVALAGGRFAMSEVLARKHCPELEKSSMAI